MSEDGFVDVHPEAIQNALNEAAANTEHPADAKKIFVALCNMGELNTGLVTKLFAWASQREVFPWYHFITEKRHHDHARNEAVKHFLAGECDYLMFIDQDVDPHVKMLDLIKLDKDIIAGNVYCWIKGELMPSIWQKAECEQCKVVNDFQKSATLSDTSQYAISRNNSQQVLLRWDPFRQEYKPLYIRLSETKGTHVAKCRCQGTGMDPWVFRTNQRIAGYAQLLETDSVGTAAVMIARRVIEKMKPPHFQFLYKPDREILLTEDHFFCWRAQLEGFKIWADPQMICAHFKKVDLWTMNSKLIQFFLAGQKKGRDDELVVTPSAEEVAKFTK